MGNLLAVLFGITVVVVALGGAESILRLKAWWNTPREHQPIRSNLGALAQRDDRLGFVPRASISLHDRAIEGNRVIYDADYAIDAEHRRKTPIIAEAECKALFFGCSFTFGLGVNDDETLPARFEHYAPDFQAFNYGCPGYGPQQMWCQITAKDISENFKGSRGAAVYVFIEDHIDRLIGTDAVLTNWEYPMPWLTFEEGQIKHNGTFYDRSPMRYCFFRYFCTTHLARFARHHFARPAPEYVPTEENRALLIHVLSECAGKVNSANPNFTFYCMIYPGVKPETAEIIGGQLRAAGIRVLDYSRLLDHCGYGNDQLYYADSPTLSWGHPKALNYDLVAQQLAKDIGKCGTETTAQ